MTDSFSRDLERFGKEVERKINSVTGHQSATFPELFPPEFMAKHTQLPTIEALFSAGGYTLGDNDDFAKIPDEDWDRLVATNTSFASWKEMMETAWKERIERQLAD